MIAHQTIRQNLQTMFVGIVLQKFQVTSPVFVGEEHVFTTITALRDVMRHSGNHRSGHSWHFEIVADQTDFVQCGVSPCSPCSKAAYLGE